MGAYHFRVALNGLWREKWINMLCTLSIATGLFLIALAVIFVYNIGLATRKLPERFSMTVFLADGVTKARSQEILGEIRKKPEVKSVRYISKEEALEELKAELRDSEYMLEGLEGNPLPASITVGLRRGSVSDASVAALAGEIGRLQGVDEVQYGRKLLSAIQSLRRNAEVLGGFLVIALSGALIFVCYSTVKVLFYRKRDEIDTLKLLGATRGFIRAPFIIEGGIIGLGGGILSALCVSALAVFVYRELATGLPVLGYLGVPREIVLWLPAAGLALGVVGAFFAIGRIKF